MAKYTKEEILKIAKQEDVRYIRLQFTDMIGTVKAVEIPVAKLKDALDDKIMFDGSSIEGFVRIKEADMYLSPDLNTWLIMTFEDSTYGKVARLICDVYTPQGKPFQGDPRYILKKMVRKMHEMGFETFNVGFEPEFYLFKLDESGKPILHTAIDNASYFDLQPFDGGVYVRRDIALELEKLGFLVQASHHEVGPGQNEITFKYDDVLSACDRVQTFKQVVKVVAKKHGYGATFMPKPICGLAGSGMHTNCSFSDKDGNDIFYDPKEKKLGLSLVCKKWMSGIIKHTRALAFITNPSVNSYKRLVSGYEAPIYACWSDSNRSSLIRIPAVRGNGTRTEIRNVDPTANPYLALACILACGLDGIEHIKESDLVAPVNDNLFELTDAEIDALGIQRLPASLHEATQEFKKSKLLKETLGEHTYNKLITAKELEWFEYSKAISEFELKRYF
ncbi:MAG: type I glutamate--ammonia ligase [Erysipelotrichaceae bacterium]|nr:type I glutamate--ammonia ligase [Erysipelotrichaceae bacterium]